MSSQEYLQAYNLDNTDKIDEAMKQCRVIPARIISITKKYVFLTIGCEQIG
jgi:hypothetical protein